MPDARLTMAHLSGCWRLAAEAWHAATHQLTSRAAAKVPRWPWGQPALELGPARPGMRACPEPTGGREMVLVARSTRPLWMIFMTQACQPWPSKPDRRESSQALHGPRRKAGLPERGRGTQGQPRQGRRPARRRSGANSAITWTAPPRRRGDGARSGASRTASSGAPIRLVRRRRRFPRRRWPRCRGPAWPGPPQPRQ